MTGMYWGICTTISATGLEWRAQQRLRSRKQPLNAYRSRPVKRSCLTLPRRDGTGMPLTLRSMALRALYCFKSIKPLEVTQSSELTCGGIVSSYARLNRIVTESKAQDSMPKLDGQIISPRFLPPGHHLLANWRQWLQTNKTRPQWLVCDLKLMKPVKARRDRSA